MKRHRWATALAVLAGSVLFSGAVAAQEPEQPAENGPEENGSEEVVRSEPVRSGYVILNGEYLPPPYVLEKRGEDLWINDRLAVTGWLAWPAHAGRGGFRDVGRHGREGGFRTRAFPFGGPWGPRPNTSFATLRISRLEENLRNDCMFVAGEGLRGCVLSKSAAAGIVDILISGQSAREKLERIMADGPHRMKEKDWERVIATFVPSSELTDRLGPAIEQVRRTIAENQARHEAALASQYWSSRPVKYVVTLAAMGLVVAACGTLLNHRPQQRARWTEVDAAGEGVPLVVRSVVLLFLLGIFDLGATLVAQQAGGFTEMNPLGSRVIENPALLAVFKLTTLAMACSILYALRRYRGAQVAAWWMCLLCTVLTFRWLTYNSMFMS